MPAGDEERRADEETLPDTSLHAYREDREEDVEGDVDKLKSGDPHESQREEMAGESESDFPEHPKD
jgi:hypothetical protein